MPKVPKIKGFTTQPLNYLTTQLLSFFVVAAGHGGSLRLRLTRGASACAARSSRVHTCPPEGRVGSKLENDEHRTV
ncbi:MAG: hypothetical protein JRF08_03090 [Deltaproteobacteria bacterium]|nr:hypothetical protein [Deltaproteobacteria bacterium]MBW2104674.1 hypothetical protein [Deltaproteobacteria bacterium]MBW2332457.1 hypothetical protein [Deltaproteobacteria bacterium]HDH87831.1 hypothetical protein [Desulfobacteraceae bacterium]